MAKWSDSEVLAMLKMDALPLNKARQQFSSWSAKIEQLDAQGSITSIEMRRMEFEAAEAILEAYGARG